MNLHSYWQQGPEAYREVKHQQKMGLLEAEHVELEARFAKVRAVPCSCDLLDAQHCYMDQHGTTEGDDSKWCRCRCHQIADEQGLID